MITLDEMTRETLTATVAGIVIEVAKKVYGVCHDKMRCRRKRKEWKYKQGEDNRNLP